MNSFADIRGVKYDEIFEQELFGLARRRETDPYCAVEDIERVLQNIYIKNGGDSDRGEMQEIIMTARIAAYEHFIAQWKAEGRSN
ncbi:MAG: hypothetical protein FWC65_05760 [Treponema sp.]|nr:hypothetical protein [Treponema sp.]